MKVIIIAICIVSFVSCMQNDENEQEISNLREEISDLESKISEMEDELDEKTMRIEELEGIIDDAYDQAQRLNSDLIIWEDDIWMISSSINGLIQTLQY